MISDFSFSKDTVGFLIEGNYNEDLANKLHKQIIEKLEIVDKISLYLEDTNIENFSLTAIVNEIMFKLKNKEHFNKIALVSDRKWIHLCIKIESVFSGVKLKVIQQKNVWMP